MKTLTSEWQSAEKENKDLRNKRRAEFWSEIGVKPTGKIADSGIPQAQRLSKIMAQFDAALSGPEGDKDLKQITADAKAMIQMFQLANPVAGHTPFVKPFSLADVSTRALKRHFVSPDLSYYEATRRSNG